MLRARELRHQISIVTRPNGSSLDSRGQLSGSDTTSATSVPARVEQLRGNELFAARQQYATASHSVTFYRDSQVTVTPKSEITFEGRTLDILSVTPDMKNHILECICGEKL